MLLKFVAADKAASPAATAAAPFQPSPLLPYYSSSACIRHARSCRTSSTATTSAAAAAAPTLAAAPPAAAAAGPTTPAPAGPDHGPASAPTPAPPATVVALLSVLV